MRAIVIREHGGRDKLLLDADVPTPRAGPGQAVVQVHACGLNHLDIFVRRGMPGKRTPLPFTSGRDIAMSAFSEPPLTTVAPDLDELARQAVGLLVDRIDGRPAPHEFTRMLTPYRLVVRRST